MKNSGTGSDDWTSITRTVYEFALGIDSRDWALYRRAFADGTLDFDYSSYHGRPPVQMTADEWVESVTPLFTGLDATQHSMSNPIVDVGDDTARCRMYMQAAHFLDDVEFTIGGYYDDTLRRREADHRWVIDSVTLTVWWRRGDPDIMRRARERGPR